LGWLTWPWVAYLLGQLPGRGYAYARALGLLVPTYLYLLFGVLGLLPNKDWALWSVTGGVALWGAVGWWHRRRELAAFARQRWRHLLIVEALFLLLFLAWAVQRAYDPAIAHTEQPMDFAFLNGILQSPHFPPRDPWFAGGVIQYYYLGYALVATLARLTGLPSGVAYNLGLAQTWALAAVGAYGLLDDLFHWHHRERLSAQGKWLGALALCGGVGLVLLSNLEGPLELGRALGLGSEAFYRWWGIHGLAEAQSTGSWLPAGHWWWWRASRVIHDENILGKSPTVITEFPIFSFILGDLHPHVLALPYFLLGLAVAGQLYALARAGSTSKTLLLRALFLGWVVGALGLLNSWDLPTLLLISLLSLGSGFLFSIRRGWKRATILILAFLCGGIIPYLPLYRTLYSQVQGIGAVYYAKTPLKHYLLCFGPWLVPVLTEIWGEWPTLSLRGKRAFWFLWGGLLFLPWLGTLAFGWGRFLLGVLIWLVQGPWLVLLLSATMALLLARLWDGVGHRSWGLAEGALILLSLVAFGASYAVEFFYLRDVFDTRMNTVFKFYYQVWVLLALSAVLASWALWEKGGWRRWILGLEVVILLSCLYYPLAACYTRAEGYRGQRPTLDGTAFLQEVSPGEYGAYRWLVEHAKPGDVLIEAPGEEYMPYTSRLSAWTGIPTIIGWPGHEIQWRGKEEEIQRRVEEVERLYTRASPSEVRGIMAKYGARYLFIGPYERERFALTPEREEVLGKGLTLCYAHKEAKLYCLPQ